MGKQVKEQIRLKNLSKALTVLKQYTCIRNFFLNSKKPDIKLNYQNSVDPDQLASDNM